MAFPTTIHAKAITPIIDVALKYSPWIKYNKAYPGKTPKNHNKNDIIITHHIPKLLN